MNTLLNYMAQLNYTIDIVSLLKCSGIAVVLCIPLIMHDYLRKIGYTKDNQLLIKEEAQECFSVIIFGICIMFGNNFKLGMLLVVGGILHVIITIIQLKKIEKSAVQE